MVGGVARSASLGGFFVAGCQRPDHDSRLLLLRSGDVESNPGPDSTGGGCASCGETLGSYRRPLKCAAGCGALSHRRQACSGLGREGQNRGIWRCVGCPLPQLPSLGSGTSAPSVDPPGGPAVGGTPSVASAAHAVVGLGAVGASMDTERNPVPSLGSPVTSTERERAGSAYPSREQAGEVATSTARERASTTAVITEQVDVVASMDTERTTMPSPGGSAISTERERAGSHSPSREQAGGVATSTARERAPPTAISTERVVGVAVSMDTENTAPPAANSSVDGGAAGSTQSPRGRSARSPTLPGQVASPRTARGSRNLPMSQRGEGCVPHATRDWLLPVPL